MSDDRQACEHLLDVGSYVLGALPEDEHGRFAAHLQTCASCRDEVAQLQAVADTLPMAALQVPPPAALKDRVMRTVRSEAELLRAAGPDADRPAASVTPAPRPSLWGRLIARPLAAAAAACVLIGAGVGVGAIVTGGGDGTPPTRTLAAKVMVAGARASLQVTGDRGTLHVAGLPSPPDGKVYQVWLVRPGRTAAEPTHTLFDVPADGRATVQIDKPLRDVDTVLVSTEPHGGSTTIPHSEPVISARLS